MNGLKLKNGHYGVGIFDFDGNVLVTDPEMYFRNKKTGKIEDFPASYVYKNEDTFFAASSQYEICSQTFSHTSDVHFMENHRGFDGLKKDVEYALEQNGFAPSFEMLKKKFLIKARIFALLTARSNSPDNFERIFLLINDIALTDEEKEEQYKNIVKNYKLKDVFREEAVSYYFKRICLYIPCNNPHSERFLGLKDIDTPSRKAVCIDFILKQAIETLELVYQKEIENILSKEHSLSIGFSDDTLENIIAVMQKFQTLQGQEFFKDAKLVSYFTGDTNLYPKILEHPEFIGKIEPRFDNQETDQALLRIKLR